MEHWDNPEYKNWGAKWGALMVWTVNRKYFRETRKFGAGGDPAGQRPAPPHHGADGSHIMASECSTRASVHSRRRLRFTLTRTC
jgi:hypothetical protein